MGLLVAKSALLSSGKYPPVVSFDFTKLTNLSPQFTNAFTFARASNAMMVDATGALTYAPNNMLLNSNNFTGSGWTNQSSTWTSSQSDPFGGNNAWLFTTTNRTLVFDNSGAAGNRIFSVYAKASTGSTLKLASTAMGGVNIAVNLNDGTVTGTGTYGTRSVGDGWYLIWVVTANPSPFGNNEYYTFNNDLGGAILLYGACMSAVTYETSPRPCDQVITTSAFYYGPRLSSRGLQIEQAATNLFINANAPATQNITVTAQAYTLSFYGTGSVTLSGVFTGTVTGPGAWPQAGPSTLTFTPTAGTLTLTLSGTVQYPQLETGTFPTSYIPTGTTALTRVVDTVTASLAAVGGFNIGAGSMVVEALPPTYNQMACLAAINSTDGLNSIGLVKYNFDNTGAGSWLGMRSFDGAWTWVAAANTGSDGRIHRAGVAWGGAYAVVIDGGPVLIGVGRNIVPTTLCIGQYYPSGTSPCNGYISRLALWRRKLPPAKLQALTIAGAPFL